MSLANRLDTLLGDAAARGDVPGVVAMITDRSDTVYAGAFGHRALGQPAAMTTDTVGCIASMVKPLTSTAALQLVEQGRLEPDLLAADYLPELGKVQVLEGFDSAGQPRLRPPKRPITLRHLLTHTAGFGYETWSDDIVRYQQCTGTPSLLSCSNAALNLPLLADPGERWCYGISTEWLGKLIERVTGQRLGRHLQQHLLEPLGMRDTAYRISPAMRARLATIHLRDDDGILRPQPELGIPQDPEFELGGGGLYGTVPDYLRFARLLLNGGRTDGATLLQPATVELMCRNQIGERQVTRLKSALPGMSHDVEFFPGLAKSWSMACQITRQRAPTGLPAGSLLWGGQVNSYFWIDLSNAIAGVFLTQILPFMDHQALPLFLDVQRAVYQAH